MYTRADRLLTEKGAHAWQSYVFNASESSLFGREPNLNRQIYMICEQLLFFLVEYVRASFHLYGRLEISIGRDKLNIEPGNTILIIGWCCVGVIGFHMIPVTGFSLSYNY